MPKPIAMGQPTPGKTDLEALIDVVGLLHQDASQVYRKVARTTTPGNGAYTIAWSLDMPTTAVWLVTADVVGRGMSGAGRAGYVISSVFYRIAGAVPSQQGATTVTVSIESAAAMDAAFGVSASNAGVAVAVKDDGVISMAWSATVSVREI